MASSVFLWPGPITYTGPVTITGDLSVGGALTVTGNSSAAKFLAGDGTAAAPSFSFTNNANRGFYNDAGNGVLGVSVGGAATAAFGTAAFYNVVGVMQFPSTGNMSWTNGGALGGTVDLTLTRDTSNILAQRNGTSAQVFRPYGYISGARMAYGAVSTALGSVTLSGASTATGNIIPVGCLLLGVATTTSTTITGASGYTVGDGSDVDRWGDITGTAVGTHSDNTNSTANPTGYFAAASAVTLTAKTANFTGGVVQVVVFYMTTGAA